MKTIYSFCHAICLLFFFNGTAHAAVLNGEAVDVPEGDLITVKSADGQEQPVRLGAIDAPQQGQAADEASRQGLAALVQGRMVTVEWYEKDGHQALVGRVWLRGADINLLQVKQGLAWYKAPKPHAELKLLPPEERERYQAAEGQARAKRLGLWADAQATPPWAWQQKHAKNSNKSRKTAPERRLGTTASNAKPAK